MHSFSFGCIVYVLEVKKTIMDKNTEDLIYELELDNKIIRNSNKVAKKLLEITLDKSLPAYIADKIVSIVNDDLLRT